MENKERNILLNSLCRVYCSEKNLTYVDVLYLSIVSTANKKSVEYMDST